MKATLAAATLVVAVLVLALPAAVRAQADSTRATADSSRARSNGPRFPVGPPVRTSWTSDRIALHVGDVVTILVDELTQASADRDESATRQHGRDLGLTGGTATSQSGGSLRTRNDVQEQKKGGSSRRERFTAEISTRVVEVGAHGMLKVEGTKKVKIDKHEQQVVVRGWVRPEDVTMDNTVDSWRVADAEILYTSNGSLVRAGGFWSKLLDLIVP